MIILQGCFGPIIKYCFHIPLKIGHKSYMRGGDHDQITNRQASSTSFYQVPEDKLTILILFLIGIRLPLRGKVNVFIFLGVIIEWWGVVLIARIILMMT